MYLRTEMMASMGFQNDWNINHDFDDIRWFLFLSPIIFGSKFFWTKKFSWPKIWDQKFCAFKNLLKPEYFFFFYSKIVLELFFWYQNSFDPIVCHIFLMLQPKNSNGIFMTFLIEIHQVSFFVFNEFPLVKFRVHLSYSKFPTFIYEQFMTGG